MGDWHGTVPTILAGDVPSGEDWDAILDLLTAETGFWSDYTPVWTSTGTQPALNDGTLTGLYRRTGATIEIQVNLTAGSLTTYGTGTWLFSLPATENNTRHIGVAYINDASTQTRPAVVLMSGSTKMQAVSTGGNVTATVPQTWTVGDELRMYLTFEA